MLSETPLADGISIKACRSDLGLEYPIFRASFGISPVFDSDERRIKIPSDITGFNAKPGGWVVLELGRQTEFMIAAAGDLLAVRRTREPRNGQVAIVKQDERVLIKQVFYIKTGVVLRALDYAPDILILPSAIEVRGTIEGLTLDGCWYKLITAERLPEK
jgi:hypothetical protein